MPRGKLDITVRSNDVYLTAVAREILQEAFLPHFKSVTVNLIDTPDSQVTIRGDLTRRAAGLPSLLSELKKSHPEVFKARVDIDAVTNEVQMDDESSALEVELEAMGEYADGTVHLRDMDIILE